MNTANVDSIEARAKFDFIRYSNCWEDADILCDALSPAPGKRILSIASAGDNAFALAADGAEVIACDLNPAQIACAELKAAAIRVLDYDHLLAFLGVDDSTGLSRETTYRQIRSELSAGSRLFWDINENLIRPGLIHTGKFEKYFRFFRAWVLPFIARQRKVNALLLERTPEERRLFFRDHWDSWRWRALFKVFFSKFVMGKLGRDPEFFRYVEGAVGKRILARAEYALSELPNHSNPYLRYILTGNFAAPALPRYLRQDHFSKVQAGISRIKFVCAPIHETAKTYKQVGFDGFNLSDIFEYINPELSGRIYGDLLSTAQFGARLVYWNMLAPRSAPPQFAAYVTPNRDLAAALFKKDLAFFYSAFIIEEVRQCLIS